MANHLLFYDGTCGLCDGLVQFTLARDASGRFHFAPLQGETARARLGPLGVDGSRLDSVYLLADAGGGTQRLLSRSDAVLFLLAELPAPWRWLRLLRGVPRPLRDALYALVARHRYRVFGRREACRLPSPAEAERFP